jgi:hypothetical protein
MCLLSSNMPEIAKIRAVKHIRRMPVYCIVYILILYIIFMLRYMHLVFPALSRNS